jgi:hypothetical protein
MAAPMPREPPVIRATLPARGFVDDRQPGARLPDVGFAYNPPCPLHEARLYDQQIARYPDER